MSASLLKSSLSKSSKKEEEIELQSPPSSPYSFQKVSEWSSSISSLTASLLSSSSSSPLPEVLSSDHGSECPARELNGKLITLKEKNNNANIYTNVAIDKKIDQLNAEEMGGLQYLKTSNITNRVMEMQNKYKIEDREAQEDEDNNNTDQERVLDYDINDIVNSIYQEKFSAFDNLDMLEKGYAREYVKEELINPFVPRLLPRANNLSSHLSSSLSTAALLNISMTKGMWMSCNLIKIDRSRFRMYLDNGNGTFRFLLSAKRINNTFYISQYEKFPEIVNDVPNGYYIASLNILYDSEKSRKNVFPALSLDGNRGNEKDNSNNYGSKGNLSKNNNPSIESGYDLLNKPLTAEKSVIDAIYDLNDNLKRVSNKSFDRLSSDNDYGAFVKSTNTSALTIDPKTNTNSAPTPSLISSSFFSYSTSSSSSSSHPPPPPSLERNDISNLPNFPNIKNSAKQLASDIEENNDSSSKSTPTLFRLYLNGCEGCDRKNDCIRYSCRALHSHVLTEQRQLLAEIKHYTQRVEIAHADIRCVAVNIPNIRTISKDKQRDKKTNSNEEEISSCQLLERNVKKFHRKQQGSDTSISSIESTSTNSSSCLSENDKDTDNDCDNDYEMEKYLLNGEQRKLYKRIEKKNIQNLIYERDIWCPLTHLEQQQQMQQQQMRSFGSTETLMNTLSQSYQQKQDRNQSHSEGLYENKLLVAQQGKQKQQVKSYMEDSFRKERGEKQPRSKNDLGSSHEKNHNKYTILNNHEKNFPHYYRNDGLRFCNKLPIWNPELKSLVLRFNKRRVLAPSAKNFLLCDINSLDARDKDCTKSGTHPRKSIDSSCSQLSNSTMSHSQRQTNVPSMEGVLQFGKIKKRRYAMDFQYPMSPVQAFGICLTFFAWRL